MASLHLSPSALVIVKLYIYILLSWPARLKKINVLLGWGCYIGEAGLAFFWSFSLTQAVYCWQEDIRLHQPLVLINQVGKALAIAIAVTTMCVLQIDSLVQSYYWWSIVLHLFCKIPISSPSQPSLSSTSLCLHDVFWTVRLEVTKIWVIKLLLNPFL